MNIKKLLLSSIVAIGIASVGFGLTAAAEEQPIAYEEQYTLPRLPDDVRLSDLRPQGVIESTDRITESVDSSAHTSQYLYYIYNTLTSKEKSEMDAAANVILDGVDPNWSDLSKVIYVHDVLVSTREYDMTLTKYYAYDNLVHKTSVCQGYAEAMWYLLYKLDIDSRIITSDSLNHAWNVVCLDGKWYHLDATWDDPLTDVPGRSKHNYFLLSESALNAVNSGSHYAPDMVFSWYESTGEPSAVGFATDTKFDNFFWSTVNKPINFLGDYYYYIDERGVQKADQNMNTTLLVDMYQERWHVSSNTYYYFASDYCNSVIVGNMLYYNTSTQLKAYNLNNGNITTVYTYAEYDDTTDYTAIYGFTYDNYTFTLDIKDNHWMTEYESTKTVSIAISTPSITSATQAKGKINLSWNAVSGATSYKVYRATSATGTKTLLKSVGITSCEDTTANLGTTYYYFVQAYSSKTGASSAFSGYKSLKFTSLAPPTLNSVTVSGNTVNLKWSAVPNATSYRVYRGTSATAAKSLLKTVSTTSCNNTSITAGTTYYYYVVAYSSKTGTMSAASNTKSITVPGATISSVTQAKGKINISWNAVSGATSYRVYRATSATGTKTLLKTVGITSCEDSTAALGTTYYYFVQAYNSKTGTAYAYSNYKSIKFTSLAPPTLNSVTKSGNTVTLKWTAVPNATSYRVYRGTSATGAKSLLKTVGITSCNNTSVTAGTTYYYYVVAYSSKTGTMSAASNTKSIKV